MDLQLSDSLLSAVDTAVIHSTPTSERTQRDTELTNDPAEETFIVGETKDGGCLIAPNNTWRSNSSETDWATTTDTSVHSSHSATGLDKDLEVPSDVLEACAGMDDASDLSYIHTPEVLMGRRKVTSRAVARTNHKKRDESSTSESTSSGDSNSSSASSTYDTATSSNSSYSSSCTRSHSSSCSCNHSSSCSCSHSSSCSCSHCNSSFSYTEHSNTSYESTDDLTDLPRAKTKARRLGKQASQKLAEKCNQS